MKTLEEAVESRGITLTEQGGLNLHFSPIPNWYGCVLGFDCPRCDNPIDWKWEWRKETPQITTDITPSLGKPIVTGGELIGYGHREIQIKCAKCGTELHAENWD